MSIRGIKKSLMHFSEVRAYILLATALLFFYLYSAFLSTQARFGFDQLKAMDPEVLSGLLVVSALILLLVKRRDSHNSKSSPLAYRQLLLPAVLLSFAALPIFWFLRSGFVNADGLTNMISLQGGLRIMHHDEMLSTLIITRMWESGIAGLRPEDTIALFSVIWGGVFVFAMVLLGGRLTGSRWPMFLALCFAGGFVQLFFGDVEFYAMVAALTAVYYLLCLEHTRGHLSIILPGFVLLLAVFSHLLAGWIIPSYLYLMIRAIRERKFNQVWLSIGLIAVGAVFLFIIVSSTGLPVHWLSHSHAMGSADKTTIDMLASPSVHYYAAVMNTLFLLFPFWGFLILAAVYRRITASPFNVVLMISAGMLLLLAGVWDLGLGPYFDWNLIASVCVPASILLWVSVLKGSWQPGMKTAVALVFIVGALHSWTWIVANHFTFSTMPMEHMQEMQFPSGEPNWVIPPELRVDL